MAYVVLATWLIQASVGVMLLVRWLRAGRPAASQVPAHVALVLLTLALWVVFLVTDSVLAAWLAFAVLSVANGIGDAMLIQRWRRMSGSRSSFWPAYGGAIRAVFRGEMPGRVTFHALFSGVVYFTMLGVCIGASVS